MIKKLLFASLLISGYAVFSQNVIYKEDFETASGRNSWENVDRDGDDQKWEFYDDEMPAFTGWYATSWSWFLEAFTPDNTLTSPAVTLPQSQDLLWLKFKVGAFDEEIYEEHYAVYIIPANSTFTGQETPVFEETLDAGYTQTAKNININITSFAGQNVKVVLRHYNCTDIAFIAIDDIEIVETPGLEVSDANKINAQVYPNPTSDFIKIKGVDKIQKIRIFDLSGKMVLENQASEADIRKLPAGQYILNVHTDSEIISKKIIKK